MIDYSCQILIQMSCFTLQARWDDMRDSGCQGWDRGHQVDTGVFGIALPTTSIVTKYKGKTKTGGSEIYDMSEEVFMGNIIKS